MKFETANGKKHVDFCYLQYSTYLKLSNGYKSKFFQFLPLCHGEASLWNHTFVSNSFIEKLVTHQAIYAFPVYNSMLFLI